MSLRLADLITANKTVEAKCPRCSGQVTVPKEVVERERGGRVRFEPQAACHRCGVGFAWHTAKNPTGTTAVRNEDIGLTDVWFCDRVMQAPAPEIVSE